MFKKEEYPNRSIHLVREDKNIDTKDIVTVTNYELDFYFFAIHLKTYYTLKTGERITDKEYRKRKERK